MGEEQKFIFEEFYGRAFCDNAARTAKGWIVPPP